MKYFKERLSLVILKNQLSDDLYIRSYSEYACWAICSRIGFDFNLTREHWDCYKLITSHLLEARQDSIEDFIKFKKLWELGLYSQESL